MYTVVEPIAKRDDGKSKTRALNWSSSFRTQTVIVLNPLSLIFRLHIIDVSFNVNGNSYVTARITPGTHRYPD